MGALFDQAAAIQNKDTVGIGNGRKPVGDEYRRTISHDIVQGLLDAVFADGVDGGGGFIEEEYAGILQYPAGNAQPLSLSPR